MPIASSGNNITSSAQLNADVVTGAKILDGTILNADIGAGAAIALSKILGAAASGANADITSLGGLVTAITLGQGGTGADLSAAGQGSVLFIGSDGKAHVLAPGTSGSLLRTKGAAADPDWVASAGFVYDGTLNSSGAATYTYNMALTTYDLVKIVLRIIPASAGNPVQMRLNGISTGVYSYVTRSGTAIANATAQGQFVLSSNDASNDQIIGEIIITCQPGNSLKALVGNLIGAGGITDAQIQGGIMTDNAALSSITILSAGNFAVKMMVFGLTY